jgi:hypothetical protein
LLYDCLQVRTQRDEDVSFVTVKQTHFLESSLLHSLLAGYLPAILADSGQSVARPPLVGNLPACMQGRQFYLDKSPPPDNTSTLLLASTKTCAGNGLERRHVSMSDLPGFIFFLLGGSPSWVGSHW